MPSINIKQERIDKTLEIAAYLEKEIEALKYVIESVPYSNAPPEGRSIIELLMLIDHAQCSYYEPVFKQVKHENTPLQLNNFTHFKKTFEPEEPENKDVQKVLSRLANHRLSFMNKLNDITPNTWGKIIYEDNKEILLIDFIKRMNHNDQVYLKKITTLVKSYQDDKATQREIQQRQQRYNPEN